MIWESIVGRAVKGEKGFLFRLDVVKARGLIRLFLDSQCYDFY
jgi:hypothetical protein